MSIIKQNVSLQSLNTFGISAYAEYFAAIDSIDFLQEIIANTHAHTNYRHQSKRILGGGSNVLLTKNVDGLLLYNALKGRAIVQQTAEHLFLKIAGGENWHETVLYCVANGWAGIENLSLIPGSVGAAPIQNIGAYGVELKDIFHELEAIHLQTGELIVFNKKDCQFGYRNSIFKQALKGQFFITSVTLKLNLIPTFNIKYGAIRQTLDSMNIDNLSIKHISDVICQIRTAKLPNPQQLGNSGSFFKNPIVEHEVFEPLIQRFTDMPHYKVDNKGKNSGDDDKEKIKIPAAWLIERCGWKGKRLGDAGVYENHALVLVNHGKASGADMWALAQQIQADVLQKFNINIQAEVNIW